MEVTDTPTLVLQVKRGIIDTINPGGDNLYTADQMCRMVDFSLITSLLNLEDVFSSGHCDSNGNELCPPAS